MFLVDTNIWLERLLEQERSQEVGDFLERVSPEQLFITDFAFHSICVILTRLRRLESLNKFVDDVLIDGAVSVINLPPQDIRDVIEMMENQNLDFDDAYQYIAAEKSNLTIVSFDTDFDQTSRGRVPPADVTN